MRIGGRLANCQRHMIPMACSEVRSLFKAVQLGTTCSQLVFACAVTTWVSGVYAYDHGVIITTTELAPAHTDVASALNVSALNFGIAGGSFVGNMVMVHAGLQTLPIVGALIGILAIGVAQLLKRY